jgi:hypothetical protein
VRGFDYVRLASLIAIVGLASFSRGNRVVINKLEEMLAVPRNDSELLAVLTHGVELVSESSLELLAGNVGELSLSNEGLSFGTHELLLKHNNSGRVGLLVLQLGNLVGDFLLACSG